MTRAGTTPPAVLCGVGVGPGDPELVTLKALRVLREADVIAVPSRSAHDPSYAWTIVRDHLAADGRPARLRLPLVFPMSKDPVVVRPAWERALAALAPHVEAGRRIAFVTEGDPLLYSSFIYLAAEAPVRWPGIRVEAVPGVSSVTAAAAACGLPLADGLERVAILPATYGTDDLAAVLRAFDTTVLVKVGSVMPQVTRVLEQEGLLDRAVYLSRVGTPAERIVRDLRTICNDRCDYFSIVLVAKRERSGLLAGAAATAAPGGGDRLPAGLAAPAEARRPDSGGRPASGEAAASGTDSGDDAGRQEAGEAAGSDAARTSSRNEPERREPEGSGEPAAPGGTGVAPGARRTAAGEAPAPGGAEAAGDHDRGEAGCGGPHSADSRGGEPSSGAATPPPGPAGGEQSAGGVRPASRRGLALVAITRHGARHGERLRAALPGAELFVSRKWSDALAAPSSARLYDEPVGALARRLWHAYDGLVFFVSLGAVVRTIAPLCRDKHEDPAVVVVDDAARFAVSVLSGHLGGANALAEAVAAALGATPVITTASDVGGTIAVDLLGREFGWRLEREANVTRASAAVVNGEPVAVIQEAGEPGWWTRPGPLPPNVRVVESVEAAEAAAGGLDRYGALLWISDRAEPPAPLAEAPGNPLAARVVVYRPRTLVLGAGCDRGATAEELSRLVETALAEGGLAAGALRALASLDRKADEPGLLELAARLGLETAFYPADRLAAVPGIATPSATVEFFTGTPSVSEAAALLHAGTLGEAELVVRKRKGERCTAAIARVRVPRAGGPAGRAGQPADGSGERVPRATHFSPGAVPRRAGNRSGAGPGGAVS